MIYVQCVLGERTKPITWELVCCDAITPAGVAQRSRCDRPAMLLFLKLCIKTYTVYTLSQGNTDGWWIYKASKRAGQMRIWISEAQGNCNAAAWWRAQGQKEEGRPESNELTQEPSVGSALIGWVWGSLLKSKVCCLLYIIVINVQSFPTLVLLFLTKKGHRLWLLCYAVFSEEFFLASRAACLDAFHENLQEIHEYRVCTGSLEEA